MGRNFLKVTEFYTYYNKDMVVIVHSPKKLLTCLKKIINQGRNKHRKFIYIYYDQLNYDEVFTEQI